MLIREEDPADTAAVRAIVQKAFGRPDEARLVERLRADGDTVLAAVAVSNEIIVGYVMLSKMMAPFRAVGLAPVAVLPKCQRRGIATQLIRWALQWVEQHGWEGVFVLGDPSFYRRFGFDPETAAGFETPYAGPHFMALAFGPALPASGGRIEYAGAFAELS